MDNGIHDIFNRQIIAEYKINERAISQQLIFKLKKKYKIMRERERHGPRDRGQSEK